MQSTIWLLFSLICNSLYQHSWKLAVFCIAIHLAVQRWRKGLREIPGPIGASLFPLDRLLTAVSGRQFDAHIKYHERYGPLVRLGPHHVSISDPSLIPQVYGINTKYEKSDYYKAFDAKSKAGPVPTIFSICNEAAHKEFKRPVANAYSMSTMVELEPVVNECMDIFQRKLDKYQDQAIDFGEWLHWYAFDVVTAISFGQRMEFMEQERDVDGIIDSIKGRLVYNATVGQIPELHKFLLGNSVVSYIANYIPAVARMNSSRKIVEFSAMQLARYQTRDKQSGNPEVMLDRFKQYRDGEQIMSYEDILSHSTSHIFAGSDTTAISLRALFNLLCKTPQCLTKLVAEIDAADLSDPVTFAEANNMSYLKACIKEAMRLHPAVGQLLERLVPPEGDRFGKTWLPGGTIVGVNPWVVGRDKSVYGWDADVFRPERWAEASPEALKMMERSFLSFGAGSRTCLGKNISLLEMHKLVPQLLRRYEIELVDPQRDLELAGYWFVQQEGLICRVTRRDER